MAAILVLHPAGASSPPRVEEARAPKALLRALGATGAGVVRDRALVATAAILGVGAAPKVEPLHASASGPALATALLLPKVAAVYGAAAAPWPDDDVEHVHDLRVATRRLREAMAVLAPITPAKALKRANRQARDLGRTLGIRRTLDVLLEDLAAHYAARNLAPDFAPTFGTYLRVKRDEATEHVKDELSAQKVRRRGLELVALTLRAFEAPSLALIAGPHLEARIADVTPLLPHIEVRAEVEQHHELRIALKHLRYATEIFGAVWPELLPAEATTAPLKELQDALGILHDTEELLALARTHRSEIAAGESAVDALIADLGELTVTRYEAARAAVRDHGAHVLEKVAEAVHQLTA